VWVFGSGKGPCRRPFVSSEVLLKSRVALRAFISGFLCLLLAGLGGCSASWYRESADKETRGIIKKEQKEVTGEEREFAVEQAPLSVEDVGVAGETPDLKKTPAPKPEPPPLAETRPPGEAPPPAQVPVPAQVMGQKVPEPKVSEKVETDKAETGKAGTATAETGNRVAEAGEGQVAVPPEMAQAPRLSVRVLTLKAALKLAFANNREHQTQREALYLSALALTLARHNFAPRFFGIITGNYSSDSSGESGGIDSDFGLNFLLMNGARLSLNLINNFFQFFSGDRREVASTVIQGSLTQPILRGFGRDIVREPLTQAERNVMYQIRAYERYRRTFAVSVISQYYRVLQERDKVTNAYNNWKSLVINRDRVEELAKAQKIEPFQVDQARQQEFQAQDGWVSAVEGYESALDLFKLTLGIPMDSEISLDQGELEELARQPVESLDVPVEEAVQVALAERLDLKTSRDALVDNERQIRVAADQLRTQLDLTANASLPSGGDAQQPLKFNSNNLAYSFGFDLNLPLDRKAERNAYVSALIDYERSRREVSLQEDNIRLTVRDSYRRLEREIVSYRIQQASVDLANRRVDSTSMLLQAGRAQTRDLLDSQTSLLDARNSLTASLITYVLARYQFFRDTEVLRVDDQGVVTVLPIGVKENERAGS